jgi:hypothetical protein
MNKKRKIKIGDIVVIKEAGYEVLTEEAIEIFLENGGKKLSGVVFDITEWGDFAIEIDNGAEYGFNCGSHGLGINTISEEYLELENENE